MTVDTARILPANYTFKLTHPNKTYEQHVTECIELSENLVRLYYPREECLLRFVRDLCTLHDVGKLLSKWSLNNKDNPPHAIEGAEWLLRQENLPNSYSHPTWYWDMLVYFVLTHHSPLYVPLQLLNVVEWSEKRFRNRSFENYSRTKKFCSRLNCERVSGDLLVKLVDVAGMFKLGDIVSALGLETREILQQYTGKLQGKEAIRQQLEGKRKTLFDERKYILQARIAELNRSNIILAAPTGWGKTALSLLRASYLDKTKVFYVLPTITAIKTLYEDLTRVFGPSNVGEYFYFTDVELLQKEQYSEDNHLIDQYRYFIPKFIITTIDQLLLTALQVGKYYLRRFNFNNALFILDEYHLLTPAMVAALRILCRNLQKLYGFSWLLMSATPNPLYTKMFTEVLPDIEVCILSDEYKKLRRHRIELVDQKLTDFIKDNPHLFAGKRVLVIANTVHRAQEAYLELKRMLKDRKISLLHSRFTYRDRSEKEKEVDDADVLVSTQVAEVSLDISFDILLTELSPIPSLIQRFGRVNRYARETKDTNVYICMQLDSYHPYLEIEMENARKNVEALKEGVSRGENIYLETCFHGFEKEIRYYEKELNNKLETIGFHSFLPSTEPKILQYLGRETHIMAIPKSKEKTVSDLIVKIRSTNSFDERRTLYAKLKELLIPIPTQLRRYAEWSDDLRCYVALEYDSELGLITPFKETYKQPD